LMTELAGTRTHTVYRASKYIITDTERCDTDSEVTDESKENLILFKKAEYHSLIRYFLDFGMALHEGINLL
jgi:hypothetical protein